jgi:hypothetical protein
VKAHCSIPLRLLVVSTFLVGVCTGGCMGDVHSETPHQSYGASGSEAAGSGGGGGETSGSAGGSGVLPTLDYAFSEHVGPEIWTKLERAVAVDSADRLFVTDAHTVFVVVDGAPEVWLTFEELVEASEIAPDAEPSGVDVISMDVGIDGRLYLLVDLFPSRILVSDGAHSVKRLYADITSGCWSPGGGCPESFAIGGDGLDHILIAASDGLYEAAPGVPQLVYTEEDLAADLGIAKAGFGYQFVLDHAGRFWQPMGTQGGMAVASTTGGRAKLFEFPKEVSKHPPRFSSVAPHPLGGAVAPSRTGTLATGPEYRVHYFGEDDSIVELSLTPTVAQVAYDINYDSFFDGAVARVGPTGTIYFVCRPIATVYRATPNVD